MGREAGPHFEDDTRSDGGSGERNTQVIKALILDVDGVLSDGGIILDNAGGEAKRFNVHDGVGIKLAQEAGWRVLFLTARNSPPALRRADEMGAECALGVAHKEQFLRIWLAEREIDWDEVAYVGDDLQDLLPMQRVGSHRSPPNLHSLRPRLA